ncbi:MAG: (Fe-S)-binding protein [bacterium]|nr:(Fe-S)-binding protein [bacterium]
MPDQKPEQFSKAKNSPSSPRIGLFVTCLVDLFRPNVGFAAIKLLEDAGCEVFIPKSQTCCGQPALNSGDVENTKTIARQVIEHFESYDYVIVPSGSCGGTIRTHYPEILADDPEWTERAAVFSSKVFELISFLTDIRGISTVQARCEATATYHDSCSGLRELGIKQQPRRLLFSVEGLTLREMDKAENCCGFGGTFSIKYPDISNAIVSEKTEAIKESGADLLLGGDLGCLMNIAGKQSRQGQKVRAMHVAEILANMSDGLAIGEED